MKSIVIIITISLLLFSCLSKSRKEAVTAVYADRNKEGFVTKNGITLLDGQPFSGWQYSLYENGDTATLVPFIRGKQSGPAKGWHANGQLSETGYYENGKRTGEHKGWWENGQLKFVHHYANDLFDGRQEEWYPGGKKFRVSLYDKGYEKGLQTTWRPDGTLHANYEVRNGRNYGLTGTAHCKNVFKNGM